MGRFLNADTLASTGQSILGNNMLIYCQNNPKKFSDHSGNICIPADPLRGGPVGAATLNGLNNSYSPGPSGSLGEIIEDFFNNEDAQAVLDAKHFAFYKNTLVVKVPGTSAFSCGIMFVGSDGDLNLLYHEYGHVQQLHELGLTDYVTYVVGPSVICFWGTELKLLSDDLYFSYPWEYEADQYGGATHVYKPWAKDCAEYYWNIVYYFR